MHPTQKEIFLVSNILFKAFLYYQQRFYNQIIKNIYYKVIVTDEIGRIKVCQYYYLTLFYLSLSVLILFLD